MTTSSSLPPRIIPVSAGYPYAFGHIKSRITEIANLASADGYASSDQLRKLINEIVRLERDVVQIAGEIYSNG